MKPIAHVELGDCFEFIRNGMNVKQSKNDTGLPITRIETISDGTVDLSRVGFAGLTESDAGKWLLQDGDILFSHINSVEHIGKCALFELGGLPVVHGMNLLCLRPLASRLWPNYGRWLIRSPPFRSKLLPFVNKAVNQASVSVKNLKSISVSLPPIEEQNRIAAILDQADSLRRLRQRAIDRLNTLGQAIFYEIFVGGGQVWPQEELSELGQVVTGATPPTTRDDYFVGNVPFITSGDLESYERVKRSLSEKGALKSRTINAGSALVCCIGATIGKIDQARERSAFKQQINAVQWKESVNANFGLYALRQIRATIIHKGKGASTTLPILKKSEFQRLRIPVPHMRLQNSFSRRLEECRKTMLSLETSLRKNRALFFSLQHRAFRGEL
jgi:type I restriction enzyme S subunit